MSSLLVGGLVTALALNWQSFSNLNNIEVAQSSPVIAQQPLVEAKSAIPQSITPCLPRYKTIKSLELLATTSFQNKQYYLVNVVEERPSFFENDPEMDILKRTTVIQKDELGCLVIIPREKWLEKSMLFYLPEAVAKQLALQSLQKDIQEAGGKAKYIQMMNNAPFDAATGPWIIFPEDAWAYKQLGMELPQPSVVVNTWDEAPEPNPGD